MTAIRSISIVFVLAFVAGIALWLQDHPGHLALDWRGYRIEMPFALAIGGVAALLLLSAVLIYGLVRLAHLPLRHRLTRARVRQAKAFDAVTYALTSLAVADHGGALKYAGQAERLLGEHPLVALVRAHVARQTNDGVEARRQLETMLGHQTTRMLAASALASLAKRESRLDEAVSHAETAQRLLPHHPPSLLRLLDLYVSQGQWQPAIALIESSRKQGVLSKGEARHLQALCLYGEAEEARLAGETMSARVMLQKAHALSPAFLPAARLLAQGLLADERWREGLRVLERSWKAAPHPDLAATLLNATRGQDEKLRTKRLEGMVKSHPPHPESELARAWLAFDLKQWDRARAQANLARERLAQMRVFRLLAEIEKATGDSFAAARWRERMAEASADHAWRCDACHHTTPDWSAHCPNCNAFDTLHWSDRPAKVTEAPIEPFAIPYDVGTV